MADMHILTNDRARAANSDADILGKLDYWRAALHECGLHTEAMVMGRAASAFFEKKDGCPAPHYF